MTIMIMIIINIKSFLKWKDIFARFQLTVFENKCTFTKKNCSAYSANLA